MKALAEQPIRQAADNLMRSGASNEALAAYQRSWEAEADDTYDDEQVWHLLAIANAAVRAGQFEEAFSPLQALLEHYSETGIVVGNPFFHLVLGLCFHGLGDEPDSETDNFARALICGGPAIFTGERPEHLQRMTSILRPPAELGTWNGYEGCSRDLLNDADGYLLELISSKLGVTPPFSAPAD